MKLIPACSQFSSGSAVSKSDLTNLPAGVTNKADGPIAPSANHSSSSKHNLQHHHNSSSSQAASAKAGGTASHNIRTSMANNITNTSSATASSSQHHHSSRVSNSLATSTAGLVNNNAVLDTLPVSNSLTPGPSPTANLDSPTQSDLDLEDEQQQMMPQLPARSHHSASSSSYLPQDHQANLSYSMAGGHGKKSVAWANNGAKVGASSAGVDASLNGAAAGVSTAGVASSAVTSQSSGLRGLTGYDAIR